MYQVTLINQKDGSVQGHRTGCADIKRGKRHADEPHVFECSSKRDAQAEYNADFDEETDGWYDIHWLPCADHVPAFDQIETNLPGPADEAPAEEPFGDPDTYPAGVGVKKGAKWTYLYAADGSLIAELRNDQLEAVAQYLVHGSL